MSDLLSSITKKDPVSVKSFLYQNGINLCIGASIFVIFSILRPNNGAVYHRRQKLLDKNKKFPKIGSGLFDWIRPVWRTTEAEILQVCGLDAVMFLRFVKLIITYCLSVFLFGIALTVINYFGSTGNKNTDSSIKDSGKSGFGSFDLQLLSLSGFGENQRNLIWGSVVFAWFSVLLVGYLIYRNNVEYINLRHEYFNSKEYQESLNGRTIMALRIPEHLQDQEVLKNMINNLDLRYKALQCSIIPKVGHLPELIFEYNQCIRELETVVTRCIDKSGNIKPSRPTHHLKVTGLFKKGEKVDSITYYTRRILELDVEIKEIRDYASNLPPSNVAFISFQDAFAAHISMQELEKGVGSKLNGLKDMPEFALAPKPDDLIWNNAQYSRQKVRKNGLIFSVMFVAILLGSIIPLTIITGLTNPTHLRTITGNSELARDTASSVLLQGIISPILVIASMLTVQFILKRLSIYQGATTHSSVDRRLLSKYYSFLILNYLIFFNLIAVLPDLIGALLKVDTTSSNNFLENFRNVIKSTGTSLALGLVKVSAFWANQLSIKTLSYLFELVQIISMTRRTIQKYFLRYSSRDLKEFSQPQPFEYSVIYAMQCFNFSLILLFATPAPLVIPFGIVNSLVAYFVYKHQLMYVYQTSIETGGRLWKTAFNRIVAALILSQFFLLLVFLCIEVSDTQWMSVLPLPFITLVASLVHQAWLDSKVEYIDWRSPYRNYNGKKDQNSPRPIDFSSQFHHPAFSQELLSLEVDPIVLNAIPELEKVSHLTAQNADMFSPGKFAFPESGRTTPGSMVSESSIQQITSRGNDSMIELLDRNSQPQKMTHF
ncbi:DUF221-domain-containing protein [Neoconidiobolus thromboides FSU 785]|nr:DUF221-domain-containing protein [Neoconidiobolus thromboides FSU 785]